MQLWPTSVGICCFSACLLLRGWILSWGNWFSSVAIHTVLPLYLPLSICTSFNCNVWVCTWKFRFLFPGWTFSKNKPGRSSLVALLLKKLHNWSGEDGGIISPPKSFVTNCVFLYVYKPATATREKYRERTGFQGENYSYMIHHLACKSLCHSSGCGGKEQACNAKTRDWGRWMKLFYFGSNGQCQLKCCSLT